MKLFWGPHTCAIGIHLLLEEIGAPYEAEQLDVAGGEAGTSAFRAINPKGKVPALLRDDGTVLTEFGAIAHWLARTHPEAALLPDGVEEETRALEVMDYAVGTLHGQAFARMIKPARFEPQDVVHATLGVGRSSVREQGREMAEQALAILDRQLAGRAWAAGPRFTVADAALFYAERWAPQQGIPLPPNLENHLVRMKARPAVARAMAAEGESGY